MDYKCGDDDVCLILSGLSGLSGLLIDDDVIS